MLLGPSAGLSDPLIAVGGGRGEGPEEEEWGVGADHRGPASLAPGQPCTEMPAVRRDKEQGLRPLLSSTTSPPWASVS